MYTDSSEIPAWLQFLFALLQLGEKFYGWVIKLMKLNVNNGQLKQQETRKET